MDMTELAQNIKWLQDERRRDKVEIERLTQRLEAMKNEAVEQSNKVRDLEGRLAAVSAQTSRSAQVDAVLEKLKKEVTLLIQQHEERAQSVERDAAVIRQTEREAVAKALDDIRVEMQRPGRYDKAIEVLKLEIQRLNEQLSAFQQQVPLSIKEVKDRLQMLNFLEDLIRRNERDIQQLQTLDAELRQQQKVSSEALQLAEVERQRQMSAWEVEFKAQRQAMDQYAARIAKLQEQSEQSKQFLVNLSQLEERVLRQQGQVSELQRLAEERQKRELGEWQAENEKRWKRMEVVGEQQWAAQRTQDEELLARLDDLERRWAGFVTEIDSLWQAQRAFAYHRVSEVQKWISDFEKLLEARERVEADPTAAPAPPREAAAKAQPARGKYGL